MANNCLITKYNAVIDNSDLENFGMMSIYLRYRTRAVVIAFSETADITIEDGYIVIDDTTYLERSCLLNPNTIHNVYCYPNIENGYVKITFNKYKLLNLSCINNVIDPEHLLNTDDFIYCSQLQYLYCHGGSSYWEKVHIRDILLNCLSIRLLHSYYNDTGYGFDGGGELIELLETVATKRNVNSFKISSNGYACNENMQNCILNNKIIYDSIGVICLWSEINYNNGKILVYFSHIGEVCTYSYGKYTNTNYIVSYGYTDTELTEIQADCDESNLVSVIKFD